MTRDSQLAPSTGAAPAHHGEILQGVFHDSTGRLCRALVTLWHPERSSRATFHPSPEQADITCPAGMWKVQQAASIAMTAFATQRSPATGGYVKISSTIPLGVGMGSSTADVTATIRAIASFHGVQPPAEKIGQMAVQAEQASDPVMIDDRVALFAHREGRILESLGRSLPPMIVVGCITDPAPGGIDTVALPPAAYSADDVETFHRLRAEIRAAVRVGDVTRLGQVATASALISQRFVPNPVLEFLLDVCNRCGACGVQVAHSGTVAGVIFDPDRPGIAADTDRCAAYLDQAGLELTGKISPNGAFQVRSHGPDHRNQSARPGKPRSTLIGRLLPPSVSVNLLLSPAAPATPCHNDVGWMSRESFDPGADQDLGGRLFRRSAELLNGGGPPRGRRRRSAVRRTPLRVRSAAGRPGRPFYPSSYLLKFLDLILVQADQWQVGGGQAAGPWRGGVGGQPSQRRCP